MYPDQDWSFFQVAALTDQEEPLAEFEDCLREASSPAGYPRETSVALDWSQVAPQGQEAAAGHDQEYS
jgi:hypothetical protein